MPHRELLLRVTSVWLARRRIPRPNLVWVEPVELAGKVAACEVPQVAHEVPVDVVRMILVLYERAVGENLADTDLPKLPGEDLQVVNQSLTLPAVPSRELPRFPGAKHQN